MSSGKKPVCFTCSQPVAQEAEINRLPDGEPCPACRDRLLDELPALLPNLRRVEEIEEPTEETEEVELRLEASAPEFPPDDPIRA